MKMTEGQVRVSASDVANFLACQQLTQLDLQAARRTLRPPHARDLGFEDLVRRGEEHERAVLERFRADGHEVADLGEAGDPAEATAAAIRGGAEVVYQGTLTGAGGGVTLFGRPDFLVRADLLPAPDGEPRPDGIPYEVVDAKLARSAKARAVLQASFYSRLLGDVQGIAPRWMHLALGNGEFASFKVDDFAAYERQTRRLLEAAIGGDPAADVYPEPVEHCAICRWRKLCAGRRRTDDDLSLVAGMTTGRRRALKGAGIPTRRGFAGLADLPRLDRVSPDVLERAQRQARLQVASEDDGITRYEIQDPQRDADGALVANRGLLALPEPADGDLFFDIEGARYYSQDGREFGLQYLFGVVDTAEADEAGRPRYTPIWAFDRPGEKRAFEELIDFITERRARHPGLHVYHYNHYEPTSVDHLTELHGTRQEAVGALMGRFATREDEVDDLFRLGVFTDLYRVVRQGVRAGVESYSIKRLEPLCGYDRRVDLEEATASLIALEAGLEDGTAAGDGERRRVVAGYNEDDCRAALALRDWLEGRRAELAERLGEELPRPVFAEKPGAAEDPELARIRSALLAGVSAETPEGQARALLADLIDWHRREDKPAWWRYFYLRTLSPAELTGEPDALGGLGRRRGGRPGQEVGGAAVPLPGAGTQVLRRRHGLRSGHGQAVAGLRRGRRARDDRPEGGQHLRRAVARRPDRGGAAQDLGAAGSAAGSRRPGGARRVRRRGHGDRAVCCAAGPMTGTMRPARCGPRARRPAPPRSGSRSRCVIRTCPCRDRRGPGRRTPRPSRSSSSSPKAARSASPGPRTPSSATSSAPCTSTRGGAEPGRRGSASGRTATTRTCTRTPRR